jgi:Na+-driven multidrug efflux pump
MVLGRRLVLGRDLLVRGAARHACFLSAAAVAGRFGTAALAAHQVAMRLWMFCALALDAAALAAQALVGAALGASRGNDARAVAGRVATFGGVGGAGLAVLPPRILTSLPSINHDRAARTRLASGSAVVRHSRGGSGRM